MRDRIRKRLARKPPGVALNRSALDTLLALPAHFTRLDGSEFIDAHYQRRYDLRWSTISPLPADTGCLVRCGDFVEYAAAVQLVTELRKEEPIKVKATQPKRKPPAVDSLGEYLRSLRRRPGHQGPEERRREYLRAKAKAASA